MLSVIKDNKIMSEKELFRSDESCTRRETVGGVHIVRELWSDFISEATVHGFSKLKGAKIRIVLWSLLILGSFSYLLFTLVTELKKYYSYPIMTKVNVEFYDQMDFPAVTICNLCWRNKSKIENSTQADTYYGSMTPIGHSLPAVNWSDPWYRDNGYFDPMNMTLMRDQAMDLAKLLRLCWFDTGYNITCEEVFEPIFTPAGVCFIFNGKGTFKTSFSGSDFNLQVYVDVSTDYYTWSTDFGSGIQILVHEAGTFPPVRRHGTWSKPGSSVYAEITKRKYSYLESPYKAFGDKYCKTSFPGWSESNEHRYSYTRTYCLHLCFNQITSVICQCKLVDSLDEMEICSNYLYQTCYFPTLQNVQGNSSITKNCGCHQPCHFTLYDVTMTTAKFPSDFAADKLAGLNSIRGQRIDAIFLRVYLKELTAENLVQYPVYVNIGDVFAKIGGQMGLFLGASVMSVLELGEFVMILIHILAKHRKKRTEIKS